MIYFDELSVAKGMEEKQSFSNGYSKVELLIYAKYLKYKKVTEAGIDYNTVSATQLDRYNHEVEMELRAFCERCCCTFNYTVDYQDIDYAVNRSSAFKLKLPLPLPITQKEWDAIQSVPNEKYQRMLFIMLVDAKYYRYFNSSVEGNNEISEDTTFYVRMTRSEIQKLAHVKYDSPSEKTFFLGCINRKGLFGISENRSRTWYIKFADTSDKNVIEYITDYEHLALYYEKLTGEKIGQCEYCGKLFRQRYLYMSDEHYIEIENVIGVKLRIRMGENLHYYCKNMNFPDLPDACFSESMTNKTMLGIIDQLKENPATEYPNSFKNRWDEIVSITSANVAQNEYKWANGRYRGSV